MNQNHAAREPADALVERQNPPGSVPVERPEDQDGFDEAMKYGYKGIHELLERRRKQS